MWTCGFNNWGQLGVLFGAEEDSALPRPLLSLQSVQPCKVSCGTNHSLMVTEGGDLCVSFTFSCQCCSFKQLKLEAVCVVATRLSVLVPTTADGRGAEVTVGSWVMATAAAATSLSW